MHGIKHKRSQDLIDFAYRYAKKAHGTQTRKYTGEPYINHPIEVARIVASVTNDCEVICAAFLHDVIEDTEVTFENIQSVGFGFHIARMVREVSDISRLVDGNRAVRKAIDLSHLAKASAGGQTIKLADLIHNTESICRYDLGFARTYMREKRALLKVLTKGNAELHKRAAELVHNYFEEGV